MALYAGPVFAALSFASYLFASIYVVDDKNAVDEMMKSEYIILSTNKTHRTKLKIKKKTQRKT